MRREDIVELIRMDMPDFTEGAFDVAISSDDGGSHIQISIEDHSDGQKILEHFSDRYKTRMLVMLVPEGFLGHKAL